VIDNDASYPLLPQRIVADVRRGLDKDAIIALDNGMYKIWFARHYHTYMPNTVLRKYTSSTCAELKLI
jgi:acetolactate synthase-1/2/3 large subunit